jgi:hypothetical protein
MLERGKATDLEKDSAAPELTTSLPGEINTATRYVKLLLPLTGWRSKTQQKLIYLFSRNLHTTLNHLITSRLPLALPPHAADSSLYATGLLHFAHIFLTFESLWADILRDNSPQIHASPADNETGLPSPPISPLLSYLLVNPYDSPSLFTSTLGAPTRPSPQLVAFLRTVRPRGLIRSARVKSDLEHLLGLHPTDLEVLLARYPGQRVADFCTHIRKTVHEKPWTLVSYAWCFYMAVFSGGRWIRAGLLKAGPEYWPANDTQGTNKAPSLAERGLSFWHFPGRFDGEDIKAEFKSRLATAETLFTSDERVDIIEEAKNIFQLCADLVQELDEVAGTNPSEAKVNGSPPSQSIPDSKEPLISTKAEQGHANNLGQSRGPLLRVMRRPEITGTLVALGCLVCVVLLRSQ